MSHHTKTNGDIAVAKTIKDLTIKGYDVFVPAVSEHLKFDLIAHKDHMCFRIQVKYSSDGAISHSTSHTGKNGSVSTPYDIKDFDYYAIYLPSIQEVVYPNISFMGKTIAFKLPKSATKFWWWEDFINLTDYAEKKSFKDFNYTLKGAK